MPVDYPTNRVLAALVREDRRHWNSHLQRVELRQGHTLLVPDNPIGFVYFPEDALVGLTHAGEPNGPEAPVALVGNDGLVGVAPFLGAPAERIRAEVLHPGSAWRLPAAALNSGPLPPAGCLKVVLGYLQALNAQISQAALCRLQHTVYQRLCRWLQDAFERVPVATLQVEAAVLSAWLGTDPETVNRAAARLVADGTIAWGSGGITLLDRALLAGHACGGHHQVKQQIDPLFPPIPPIA